MFSKAFKVNASCCEMPYVPQLQTTMAINFHGIYCMSSSRWNLEVRARGAEIRASACTNLLHLEGTSRVAWSRTCAITNRRVFKILMCTRLEARRCNNLDSIPTKRWIIGCLMGIICRPALQRCPDASSSSAADWFALAPLNANQQQTQRQTRFWETSGPAAKSPLPSGHQLCWQKLPPADHSPEVALD